MIPNKGRGFVNHGSGLAILALENLSLLHHPPRAPCRLGGEGPQGLRLALPLKVPNLMARSFP